MQFTEVGAKIEEVYKERVLISALVGQKIQRGSLRGLVEFAKQVKVENSRQYPEELSHKGM